MMMKNDICGIYMIENKKTGQQYIGQSIHIYQRWYEHIKKSRLNTYINRAIKKHGADNFELKVICELEQDDDLLNEMEKYYVWKYNTYEDDFHYNLTPGGDFSPMKVSEIAMKVSKALSGENNPMYGKKHSEETIKKMSKAKSGENNPMKNPEIAAKISGKNNPNYGGLSDEHREKISRAQNTTGFFRVYKHKSPTYKQGFIYAYQYYGDDKKHHAISSVSLEKLEKKVKAKGLEWFKLEDDKNE